MALSFELTYTSVVMANPSPNTSGLRVWKPGESGNKSGFSTNQRAHLRSLALTVRRMLDPEECVQWLVTLWRDGKDSLRADEVVDLKVRLEALQTLLNRGWGLPAQHVIIEGEIRNELIVNQTVELPQDLDEVRKRRDALRAAGVKKKVIDVAGKEVPTPDVTKDAQSK